VSKGMTWPEIFFLKITSGNPQVPFEFTHFKTGVNFVNWEILFSGINCFELNIMLSFYSLQLSCLKIWKTG
jgi:hypothetical protein